MSKNWQCSILFIAFARNRLIARPAYLEEFSNLTFARHLEFFNKKILSYMYANGHCKMGAGTYMFTTKVHNCRELPLLFSLH